MNYISDQDYLRNRQYRSSENLEARIQIHRLYSTNPYGWYRWQYEFLNIQAGENVLDLGCGPGALWSAQRERLPADASVTMCDLSRGMVANARGSLAGDTRFTYAVGDAQSIPFRSARFDLVTANHMLYHVPDIQRAAREIQRVMKPGGRFAAATNGRDHLRQLHDLIRKVAPEYTPASHSAARFGLENGPEQLREIFPSIEEELYPDDLWVTQTEALMGYIASMWGVQDWGEERRLRMRDEIQHEIDTRGGFFIQKSSGVILARLE